MAGITVTPAYGRDYKSAKAAKADWEDGKDFLVASVGHSGYVSKSEADEAGLTVYIRYAKLTKIVKA